MRTLSTIQHIIQRSRERKVLPLAPTEAIVVHPRFLCDDLIVESKKS